jgi:K+-sensing histidine kinase KdpD
VVGAPHVLACVGSDAGAQAVIDAGVRIARERRARLHVLHVQQPGAGTRMDPAVAQRLARTLRRAADMGALVEVVADRRVAATILRTAQQRAAGTIVLGDSRRPAWQRLLAGDICAQIRARAAGLEVLVVGG